MKLFFCEKCQDVVKFQNLDTPLRFCSCGQCAGWYLEDGQKGELFGPAFPLGLENSTLTRTLKALQYLQNLQKGLQNLQTFVPTLSVEVKAFGILEPCFAIQRVDLQTLADRFPSYRTPN